jgi:hypothetical protein
MCLSQHYLIRASHTYQFALTSREIPHHELEVGQGRFLIIRKSTTLIYMLYKILLLLHTHILYTRFRLSYKDEKYIGHVLLRTLLYFANNND